MSAPTLKVLSLGDIFDALADAELENGEPDGCSPWSCRSGAPVQADIDLAA